MAHAESSLFRGSNIQYAHIDGRKQNIQDRNNPRLANFIDQKLWILSLPAMLVLQTLEQNAK